MGIDDQPTVAIRMKIGRICYVDISWINPLGAVEQNTDLKLEAGSTVSTQKLTSQAPMIPGKWAVRITSDGTLFVEKQFIVFPVTFDKAGQPLSEPSLLNAKRITILKPGMDAEKYMDWRSNVFKNGIDLENWLDKLVTEYWSLKSSCSYATSVSVKNVCRTLPKCLTSSWSSYYPDVKSELGPTDAHGRIR